MVDARTVASCILNRMGSLSTMKLQKLVFYSQAFCLVQCGRKLFPDRIEAWANGPVVPSLFQKHKHAFVIGKGYLGDERLEDQAPVVRNSVEHVIKVLGNYTGADLSELTHSETPWIEARKGCPEGARSNNEITAESICSYYGSPECTNPVFA